MSDTLPCLERGHCLLREVHSKNFEGLFKGEAQHKSAIYLLIYILTLKKVGHQL